MGATWTRWPKDAEIKPGQLKTYEIRKAAAEALGEIGDSRAIEPLTYVARNDKEASVREAAAEALAAIEAKSL